VERGGASQELAKCAEMRTSKVSVLSFFLAFFLCPHLFWVTTPLNAKRRRTRRMCCFNALSLFFV
jgi:hypothetical protein